LLKQEKKTVEKSLPVCIGSRKKKNFRTAVQT